MSGQGLTIDLHVASPPHWITTVMANFDAFLLDHAANERKASAVAMSMVAHYPDRPDLLTAMTDLALEELNHFRQCLRLIITRGLVLPPDEKDAYVNALRAFTRRGKQDYFLDRLLMAGVIEARGAERFRIVAGALADPELQTFYQALARSEAGHHRLFVDLALDYFEPSTVHHRLDEWLCEEARILSDLPVLPRLH